MCDCLQLTIEHNAFGEQTIVSEIGGVLNGYNWWSFLYGGETLYIFWFGGRWFCSDTLGGLTNIYVAKYGTTDVCLIVGLKIEPKKVLIPFHCLQVLPKLIEV